MKNVKINNLKATHDIDGLVLYGRQLHSEAVFMGVLKLFKIFRLNKRNTVQFKGKHTDLNSNFSIVSQSYKSARRLSENRHFVQNREIFKKSAQPYS